MERYCRPRPLATLSAAIFAAALLAPGAASAAGVPNEGIVPSLTNAKASPYDDPSFVMAKEQGRVRRTPTGIEVTSGPVSLGFPSVGTLDTSDAQNIIETEVGHYDDHHVGYSDMNYVDFCLAGQAAVAAFFVVSDPLSFPARSTTEPYGPHMSTTYWRSSDTGTSSDTSDGYATEGRNYEMYMAEQVQPPSFSTPGIDYFNSYPTTGGAESDVRKAVNWEASNHTSESGWYIFHSGAGTLTDLENAVRADVIDGGAPTLVTLHTDTNGYHLPNWSHDALHAISIVGYNDQSGQFTYIDTLGRTGNMSSGNRNGGTYNVAYNTLYQLVKALNEGYDW